MRHKQLIHWAILTCLAGSSVAAKDGPMGYNAQKEASDAIAQRGLGELYAGRPDNAYRLFKWAGSMPYDADLPVNIQTFLYRGLAKCVAGDSEAATTELQDYACMANVVLGNLSCPATKDPAKLSHLSPKELHGLTAACAEAVCWGEYRQSYLSPSEGTRTAVTTGFKLLSVIQKSCTLR